MRRHDGRELRNRAGPRITLQEQMQHGHEVALAAAEAAVQVGRLARRRLERAPDEAEGVVERLNELRSDDVTVHRLGGVLDALRQAENEIAAMDLLRQINEIANVSRHQTLALLRRREFPAGGCHARTSSSVNPSARASSSTKPAK